LERRLQLLRRAVKIRADGEEEKLEELATKWRSVGREIAWELWAVIREQGQSDSWGAEAEQDNSGRGGQKSSWGWDDTVAPGKGKKGSGLESNWGFADSDNDEVTHGEETMDENGTWAPASPTKLERELWKSIRKTTKKPMLLDLDLESAGDPRQEYELELATKRREAANYDAKISSHEEKDSEDARAKETTAHTLGTMLKQFGIADETLGWNEDEEDFVASS
jgi:hypothetical protein